MKNILITGSAGFIGFHLAKCLLDRGFFVKGIDSMNEYYDKTLKANRNKILLHEKNFEFEQLNLEESAKTISIVEKFKPDLVIHLAAQAGVRYSSKDPYSYVSSNLIGSFNLLESVKQTGCEHLLLASTSSVYGGNKKTPFIEKDKTERQKSFYAATKKSMEVMSHSYSHLHKIPTTCFRFFTVYGPWGRPDMALFKFTKAILNDKPIDVYNYGKMTRDFTYIDDLVECIVRLMSVIPVEQESQKIRVVGDSLSEIAPWRSINIGSSKPVELLKFIELLEKSLAKKAKKNFLKIYPGDIADTHSDNSLLIKLIGYSPNTSVSEGIDNFVKWYKEYYINDRS